MGAPVRSFEQWLAIQLEKKEFEYAKNGISK
jgi:hypothetical protein